MPGVVNKRERENLSGISDCSPNLQQWFLIFLAWLHPQKPLKLKKVHWCLFENGLGATYMYTVHVPRQYVTMAHLWCMFNTRMYRYLNAIRFVSNILFIWLFSKDCSWWLKESITYNYMLKARRKSRTYGVSFLISFLRKQCVWNFSVTLLSSRTTVDLPSRQVPSCTCHNMCLQLHHYTQVPHCAFLAISQLITLPNLPSFSHVLFHHWKWWLSVCKVPGRESQGMWAHSWVACKVGSSACSAPLETGLPTFIY